MISRIAVQFRWLRKKLSRAHWTARLLGIPVLKGETSEPGVIVLQIDGLSRTEFDRALRRGRLPFIAKLIRRGHFTLEDFYSGVPSTTPAVQGEIFYGVHAAVPSFEFLRRSSGRIFRMYEAAASREIEEELLNASPEPLIEGGHVYSDIYRAGAASSHYCSQDMAPERILESIHPFKVLLLCILYAPKVLRVIVLAVIEFVIAIGDAFKGVIERGEFFKELAFIPARVLMCIVIREMIRIRVLLDLERGVRVIHANFLGYDEQAHRRGPDSAFAHWTLKGIDEVISEIYRSADRSHYCDYECIIHSDHGQEHAIPFSVKHGRPLTTAIEEVFSQGPLKDTPIWTSRVPEVVSNAMDRFREFLGLARREGGHTISADPDSQIIVCAMGPIGHIYLPSRPSWEDMCFISDQLVEKAEIPLVLVRNPDGKVRASNPQGVWELPADAEQVLGSRHPFLEEAAHDLAYLCGLKDAGDFVISGWDPEESPLTFPSENGAHGGPGSDETRGFILLPDRIRRWHVAHLAATRKRVRGEDLRKIVMHYLGKDGTLHERAENHHREATPSTLRVMTYNIHSCVGIDGKIRPERIARVINQCDADIVAVQEIDVHRLRSGGHDQAQLIADHLRMGHVFHAVLEEDKERYGIGIFSRYPFKIIKAAQLTGADRKSFREARAAIWVEFDLGDGLPFHFINTHFGLGRDERRRQAIELLGPEWIGSIPENEPLVLCGDLNSGPRSHVCRMLQGRLRDAQALVQGHRPLHTFPSLTPMVRIDHIFVNGIFEVKSIQQPRTPNTRQASDHLPLCVELSLNRESVS